MTVDSLHRRVSKRLLTKERLRRLPLRVLARGQAMVEFALIASVALIVLLVGIQFAIIGQAALAVSQAAFLGARYAAVNAGATNATVKTQIVNNGSPTITESSGGHITIPALVCKDGTGTTQSCASRVFGWQVSVTVNYDASSKIVLGPPAGWSIGSWTIRFPTALSSTQSMMVE